MTEVESKQSLALTPLKSHLTNLESHRVGLSNIIYQVSIAKDCDTWCALIGKDLQDGISGFGVSLKLALYDLANQMNE